MGGKMQSSQRDTRGRFVPGNKGGPGGSRKRAFTLRQAAEEAISTEHIEAMIRKATRMGLEGNLSAMRLVLDRVCGRPVDAPTEPHALPLELPPLQTAVDCNGAIGMVIEGVVQGVLGRDDAKLLIDAVQTRLKAIELNDVVQRLSELEMQSQVPRGRWR